MAALAVFALVLCFSGSSAPAATSATSFAPGTLIIPMDATSQNLGMWKAYGLVYRLLQNGIPVSWAINLAKTGINDVDFTASVHDLRTATAIGSYDYRNGPFVVDSADAAAAEPIIRAWWAANANQPNVHVADSGFDAEINVTLRSPPRIAQEAINANITIAYYNAAGIPDANGAPWSTKSPNVFTQAQIAAGGLFEQGVGCPKRKYDIFVTPHNGGYSYSLTDPTNLGTQTYAQLDNFVHDGGGWTALCHSILSNENAIADLTRNGSPAVKALFKTSLEGGEPGGFLTTNGFPTISNVGGTWKVNPDRANLPIAQMTPTTGAQSLPGGSVQTWPHPGFANSPTYWAHTETVASFTASNGNVYDHIISGTYHDGTGAGKLTFIGGHSFSTSLPYSGNTNGPYLRAFYNSLLFNGAAVAKLDLRTSPETFPQNGTTPLNISVVNTGGSVATNARDVGITLAPGFTYLSTTAGPPPDVVDGQHLVWNSLGDVAGGATPVTIQVAVSSAVSGTTGGKQVATFHAAYGDVFGEGFTADVCRDITVTPVPAPALTKTPSTQGPVSTGSPVTWTLAYGNTGSAALQGAVLEDTLPKGFTYVSSTSSPTLGAPTVIPAPSGTIVRWTVGTLSANTPAAGTVTITARAGAVTAGEGTPPHQSFTNTSKLTGTDAAGTPFEASARADVEVQALDLTLGKSVDETSLTSLPGTLTYTLTPASSTSDLLSGVRVIDPYPAGLAAPPDSIGGGGTYGAYVPIGATPGHDDGPPVLDSAFTVDHDVVDQGAALTVTLNLRSSTAVANVTPDELGVTGGTATCAGPSPASASVPAGGTGVNFTWSCTLDDTGEYVFSGGGSNADGSVSWSAATSASVLSVAGGGPNVITWNLGSTTGAEPGEVITSGTTSGIFAFRGGGQKTFERYDTTTGGWAASASALANVNPGGALTTNGVDTVWGMSGDGKQAFWSYDVATGVWTARANTGVNVKAGGALQYLNGYVYALMGNGTNGFRHYDVASNTWTALAVTPGNVKEGGALTTDGTYIYALQGNGGGTYAGRGFWRYDPATNTWTPLSNTPDVVKWGGALVYVGGSIYASEGAGKNVFWRYDIATNTWTALANAPEKFQDGGALTTDGTDVFAFVGKTKTFYRYNTAANTWTKLADFPPGNVGQGGALAYVPGNHPEGRFTSLEASRSLVGTGDTITVTFTLRSNAPVSGVTAGSLVTTPTGGASCSSLIGPTLTSADADIADFDDPVTYEWTCTVAAGSTPGSLVFSDTTAASDTVSFPAATSNSALVSPPLTFTATVPAGTTTSPIVDQGLLSANGQTTDSPPVETYVGEPKLTIVKSTSPASDTPLRPGDPIRYTMVVENIGVATATNVVVHDPVPPDTVYTSCSGGTSCAEADGTVAWEVGTLEPGDTATVSFEVATAGAELPISSTPYTISNAASAISTETPEPSESNTVTNELDVQPELVKSVSATEAAPGDTLTYRLTVSNPGAEFSADLFDPLPAGTAFAGSCTPDCIATGGNVTWMRTTIPHGTSTFSYDVTVTAQGGATVSDTATLDPTSPDLPAIDSNPVETTIGPELAVVKTNDPTGEVAHGDTITYTLLVSNESSVTARDVTVTDRVPDGTAFDSCAETCTESGGVVTWHLGDVDGGASVTLTFTVTVGTPPAGTFQLTNQAQATASNTSETATSNIVTNALPFAELQLTKSAARETYSAVGDVVHYTYVVRNNSTTSTLAGPVSATDDNGVGVTCPSGAVAPLAAITCTGEHTVTQADLDAGSIVNTATAHANGIDSNDAQATVTAAQTRSLTLTKSITSNATYTAVGQKIGYSYHVTNTGNVTLDEIAVEDDNTDASPSCPSGPLAPGDSVTCTAEHTVTQDDLDHGDVVNHATASATGAVSNTDSATAHGDPSPAVTIAKSSNATASTKAGDTITYRFDVTNTGDVTITSFAVSDLLEGVSPVDCGTVTSLAPGASAVCTATYKVAQADVDEGAIDNSVTVIGTTAAAGDVTDHDTLSTTLTRNPAVTIVKSSNATVDTAAGDTITYRFDVTNTGDVTITSFRITDHLAGLSSIDCHDVTSLAPKASVTCSATYTVTQDDVNGGSVSNTASVDGTTAAGSVSDDDTLVTSLTRTPELALTKHGVVDATVVGAVDAVDPGDRIDYTLTATNPGNVTLTGVTVDDPALQGLTCTPSGATTLAPGDSLVCTGSHTLTQADIDAGLVDNTATADSDQTTPTDARETVRLPQAPALTLVKTDNLDVTPVKPAKRRADAGDQVDYTLTATNTGNMTLHDVTIDDPALGTLDCAPGQPATLGPGEQLVCTGSHTLTQAELDAGKADNTATAHSTEAPPVDATNEVGLSPVPGVTLTKRGVPDTTVVTPSDRADVGDRVDYTLTATNVGNVTLTGVTIGDPKLGTLICTQPATLAPGESLVCTGRYTLTQADLDAGKVANTATVTSDQTPTPTEAPETVTVPQSPVLELAKDGDLVTTVVAPDGRADAGDRIDYTLTATNAGNTTLHDVTITDPTLGTLTCTQPATLAPGDKLVCTGTHTLTQGDIDAGTFANTATAHSTETAPPPVSEKVDLPAEPALSLEKIGTLDTTVVAPNDRADAGDKIDYTLTATNTGNTTLHVVAVSDPKLGTLTCAEPTTLAPGESLVCTASHILTQADIEAGAYVNSASAHSAEADAPPASETVTIPHAPELTLGKDGELVTSVVSPADRADAGDRVDYTLTATNTGNVTLTGVTVSDPSLPSLTCTPGRPASLAPGDTLVCKGSRTLTQADIDAGTVANTATADSTQTPSTPPASETVAIPPAPALALEKTGTLAATPAAAGGRVDYTLTATNTGNTTLHNVTISDSRLGTLTCAQPATLAPGAKLVCTGSYTLTQADVDAGTVANTATAHSTETTSPPATETVALPATTTLELTKHGLVDTTVVGPADRADAGDRIDYTLTATNTGSSTLHNVTISDPKLGTLTCAQPATLAPGGSLVCTGSYTLTQADIDAGKVVNTAAASSTETSSPPASETVVVPQSPVLELAKDGDLVTTVVAPDGRADAGDRIDYTLTATNAGNTTLHDVTITDTTLGTLDCTPAQPAVLAPGDKLVCTGSHTVTQANVDAGTFGNSASAHSAEVSPPPATETITFPHEPGLSLEKTGTLDTTVKPPTDRADVGDRIDYILTATNTGNTTLHGVQITDASLGTLTCSPAQPATLAPGDQLVCKAAHALTLADIDAGKVANSASADSTETAPTPPVSETVTIPQAPALALEKTGTLDLTIVPPDDRANAGDRVHYTLTATNTGNTTLHNVRIDDTTLTTLTCAQPATLAPGDTLVCTGTHTLTQSEVDAGKVDNTATAHSAEATSPPAANTITYTQVKALTLAKHDTLDMTVVDPATRADAGDVVHYQITASNAGNVTLTGVHVDDPKLGALACLGPAGGVAQPVTLAPGEDVECIGVYRLTQADIDAGTVGNTATADSDQTAPTETPNELPVTPDHALTLVKSGTLVTNVVAPDGRADVGDRIDYTLTATNAGNVTQTGVTVTDPKLGTLTCAPAQPATIAPGDQIVCSGSHTLTQADLEAGQVVNAATASSNEASPPPVSETTTLPPAPGLSLQKTGLLDMTVVAPNDRADVGDRVDYTLTATNTGNTTLHDVAIDDSRLGKLTCPQPATLAPGDALVCTAAYTLTQADLDEGGVANSATAQSDETSAPPASATVAVPPAPALTLAKTGALDTTVVAPNDRADVGDKVDYTLTATNLGNTTLHGVTVTDAQLGTLSCTQPATLAPGEALVCKGSYTLTQADLDEGTLANSATADSSETAPTPPVSETVTLPPEPHLLLEKTGKIDLTVVRPTDRADAGDRIDYTLTATNSGNTTLHHVAIADPKLGTLTCTQPTTLAPGEQLVCTGSHTLTQADLDSARAVNSASATSDEVVPPPTAETVTLPSGPQLTLVKHGELDATVVAPDDRADAGDRIDYTLTATNTGNTTLHGVTITDPKLGTLTCTQPATLAPGEQLVCTGSHTLTQADLDTGAVDNSATAKSDETSAPPAAETVPLPQTPGLTLEKTGTLDMTVVAPNDRADAGDRIDYTLTATNTGNTTLHGVTITDPKLGTLTCTQPTTLAPGDKLVCTAGHTLTLADLDTGDVVNAATVRSTEISPPPVQETVALPGVSVLELTKHGVLDTSVVAPSDRADAGDRIDYTLTATNTGNRTLHGVTLTDPKLGTLTCAQPATLAPGEKLVCTGSHTLTQADVDAGRVGNTARVVSDETPTPTDTPETVTLPQTPALTLAKDGGLVMDVVAPAGRADAGDRIDYTLTATNTGNTTLHGVTIADPKLGTLTCTQPATLAPGEQLVCTGSHTLTQADLDAGTVDNSATVQSDEVTPPPTPETVQLPRTPALTLAKRGVLDVTVVAPEDRTDAGDRVDYTLTATNTGNTTLHGVTITDSALGTLTCTQPATLAPGDKLVCTAEHTLTQAEIDAGKVDNAAIADSRENTPANTSTTVPLPASPELMFEKSGTLDTTVVPPNDRADAGDTIEYALKATNTGDTTLHDVTVGDPELGPLHCSQPATLAPGDTLVCTAAHTLSQADVDAGTVENAATAHSAETPPRPTTETIPEAQQPELTLEKTASVDMTVAPPNNRADAGDEIRYTLTATNTGNTTLHDVTIADPKLGTLACTQPTTLAPGDKLVCTAGRALTQPDVDAGTVANTATAHSTEASSSPASETTTLPPAPELTLAKTGKLDTAVVAPTDRADAGDRVDYTLTATNIGNTTLHDVAISDRKLGPLTCTPVQPATLAPGRHLVCTGSYTLARADLGGDVVNNATADSNETPQTPPASETVAVPPTPAPAPAISLVKRAAETSYSDVGAVLHYTYVVTNTGDVPFAGPVTVSDNETTVDCPPLTAGPLEPGGRVTCTATYGVTQGDLDAGRVTNTATARVDGTSSNPSTASVGAVQVRSLSLLKSTTPENTTFRASGDTIHYAYVVTNTGNVAFAGPVTVDDNRAAVTCPAGGLAPDASMTCTATYTVTQADVNAGSITNAAAAHANGTDSNEARVTVTRTARPTTPPAPSAHPSIAITKTPASQRVTRGGTATFTIRVTNTGNVTLRNVAVTDPRATACSRTSAAIAALGSLAPGASVSYRCSLANVGASFTNVATANGTGPQGARVTASGSAVVTAAAPRPPEHPAVRLVKGPALQRIRPGGVASFVVTVRNTGNVRLRNVTVVDSRVPDCARQFASLAAGETRTYRCTLVGVRTSFRHLATVSGRSPAGTRVRASAAVPVAVRVAAGHAPQSPAILIVKDPDLQTVAPGHIADFRVVVRNVGDVTLHAVQVSDQPTPACDRTVGTLAPNQVATYTCQSVPLFHDFTNKARVTGVSPRGVSVGARDYVVVLVKTAPAPKAPSFTG